MSFWSSVESIGSGIVNGVEDVASAGANMVEGAASGALNVVEGAASGAVNLVGGVLQGAEGLVCPLLSSVLGPAGGLLSSLLGGSSQSALPFSQIASAANPAQFATNLSSASDSLGGGLDLSGVSQLEQNANTLEAQAQSSGSETDAIQAQAAAEKLNQIVSLITAALSERASLDDKISSNLKTQ